MPHASGSYINEFWRDDYEQLNTIGIRRPQKKNGVRSIKKNTRSTRKRVIKKMKNKLSALLFLIFTLNIPFSVFADTFSLPDYQHEMKPYDLWLCDDGATSKILYRGKNEYVTEAKTKSDHTFIMFFSGTRGEAYFLVQVSGASEITSITQEEWYGKIRNAAPNYYSHIRGGSSDCYREKFFPQDD